MYETQSTLSTTSKRTKYQIRERIQAMKIEKITLQRLNILTGRIEDVSFRPRCAHWNPILHEERHNYRYGICPQCGTRIQVRNNRWQHVSSRLSELRTVISNWREWK